MDVQSHFDSIKYRVLGIYEPGFTTYLCIITNTKSNAMEVGQKYITPYGNTYTVVTVTEKRIVYTDNKPNYAHTIQGKKTMPWLSPKGFQKRIDEGYFKPTL